MQNSENRQGSRIGELAAQFDINPKTIRYYEEIGLIDLPARSPAGYRLYTESDFERIQFILKAKAMGLTLEEIGEIVKLRKAGCKPCQRVHSLVERRIAAIDELSRILAEFRQELVRLSESMPENVEDEGGICGIVEKQEVSGNRERIARIPLSLNSL